MKAQGRGRWALSFADLCLLLLGFFVMLQARPDPRRLAAGMHAAFGTRAPAPLAFSAARWFEPGEAVLRPAARAALVAFARGGGRIGIVSHGTEAAAARFDGWELAAARAAAVARVLTQAGVAQDRIALTLDPAIGGGQTIEVDRH